MQSRLRMAAALLSVAMLAGCVTQTSPVASIESQASLDTQRQAQAQATSEVAAPQLKRKIALGRISNETTYGRSLVRDNAGDPLGKQVSDMLAKALTESGQFVVLERTDINKLQDEAKLTGQNFQAVGADLLVMGSLTEFGRKTVGKSGFLSSSKEQVAYAKMDVRLVDTKTGQVVKSVSGAGQASNEAASILGYGSRATYDGTLNDKAIGQAVSEIVNQLVTTVQARPWSTNFLGQSHGQYIISGGVHQGLQPGMVFSVRTAPQTIKSAQTGFNVRVPGQEVARIEVVSSFGDSPESEGSFVKVVSGSINPKALTSYEIVEAR